MRAVRGSFPIWVKVMADSPSARGAFHEDSRRRALRGVEGQRLQKLLGGNMVLVSPERTPTERQRVAFDAAEQEASTREPAHGVGADDDAREIPDRIRDASFEPQDVPLGGPAGMFPAEIPEDADHRHPAIDSTTDPIADLPQDRVGRLLTRDGVKAIAPPEIVVRYGSPPPAVRRTEAAGRGSAWW